MKSLSLSSPHIIAMVGMPGSGKTQFANKFSETFSAPALEIGKLIKHGLSFDDAQKITKDLLEQLMKTKQTIILDGMTDRRVDRSNLNRLARENGYKVLFVWVQANPATAKQRSARKHSSTEYDEVAKRFSAPHDSENYVVISGHHTYNTQAKTLLKKLSENARPQTTTHINVTPLRSTTNRPRS